MKICVSGGVALTRGHLLRLLRNDENVSRVMIF